MAKIRSPNYPGISLPDAIERIKKIHSKAHTHKVDAKTIAQAAGYGGLNGAALTVLSALKKYTLLEESGKELRVSPLAMTIIADPVESQERREAIQAAAFAPVLFVEIRKQFPGTVPGDEIVRSFLIKRAFSASSVDTAIRAFRETMALVTDEGLGYDWISEQQFDKAFEEIAKEAESRMNPVERAAEEVGRQSGMGMPKNPPAGQVRAGHKRDTFSLDQGQAALEWPENLTADSYEDFESWIQLQLRKIKRSIQ